MAKNCVHCGFECEDSALLCPNCGKFTTKLNSDINSEQIDNKNKKSNITITRAVSLFSVLMNLITILIASQSQALKYVCMLSGVFFFICSILIFFSSLILNVKEDGVDDKSSYLLGAACFIIFLSFTDFIVCVNNSLFG